MPDRSGTRAVPRLAAGLDALGGHAAEAVVLLHDRRAAADVSGGADVAAPAPDDDAVVPVVPAGPDLDALGGRGGRAHEQEGEREGDVFHGESFPGNKNFLVQSVNSAA